MPPAHPAGEEIMPSVAPVDVTEIVNQRPSDDMRQPSDIGDCRSVEATIDGSQWTVIAYRVAGGALDTIIEGETGLFFPEVTPSSLGLATAKFEDAHWDSAVIANSVGASIRRQSIQG
jgi:hypothetical protein